VRILEPVRPRWLLTLAIVFWGCSSEGLFTTGEDNNRSDGPYADGQGRSSIGVGRVISAGTMTVARGSHRNAPARWPRSHRRRLYARQLRDGRRRRVG
jgi:hypothetical protein